MLSGEIKVHEEPKKYGGVQYPSYEDGTYYPFEHDTGTWKELQDAIAAAKQQGFHWGAKVKVKRTQREGKIGAFATSLRDGFDGYGGCTPLRVEYEANGVSFAIYYGADELELIK